MTEYNNGWFDFFSAPRTGEAFLAVRDRGDANFEYSIVWYDSRQVIYPWRSNADLFPDDYFDCWKPLDTPYAPNEIDLMDEYFAGKEQET